MMASKTFAWLWIRDISHHHAVTSPMEVISRELKIFKIKIGESFGEKLRFESLQYGEEEFAR